MITSQATSGCLVISLKHAQAASAVIASEGADYERFGVARGTVAPWEDGARTDNRRGTYEWWYFDAHLEDGSSLVVVFMNKDLASPHDSLTPTIRIDLDLADGRSYQKLLTCTPGSWQSSTRTADVRIGENRFSGDLHTYSIHATVEEVTVDVTLVGQVPAWRPETGYLLYGAERDKEFAWLPSVPQGAVTAMYRIGDEVHETTGVGYHDHNWGNVSLAKIVHHWYWARGQAGPYSVIASLVTAHEEFGYTELPIFMLAREGEVVADDSRRVRFEALDSYTDQSTGKPVATRTRYTYAGEGERWIVTFTRDRDLAKSRMIEQLHGPKRVLAQLSRFDGAYLRFAGTLDIEHHRGTTLVEQHSDPAIWELMYFGHARV
jgi:predicted secreted hydrolase